MVTNTLCIISIDTIHQLAKLPKYVQKASNNTLNFSKRYFVQIAVTYLQQNFIRTAIIFLLSNILSITLKNNVGFN